MSGDTSNDPTPAVEETSDESDEGSRFQLSRREYFKGIGMAGLSTIAGASAGSAAGAVSDSDVVSVGSGGYTTAMPSDANIDADYGVPPSSSEVYTTSNATGPIPSNDWWTTIALGTEGDPHGQGSVVGLPYYADTNERGLTVQYPSDWFGDPAEEAFLKFDYLNTPKLTIGHSANSSFADSRADDWGDWHVRAKWGEGTATTLDATLIKGSPFFFAEYEGGDAKITLETKDSSAGSPTLADTGNISVWADRGNVLGITVDGISGDNYSKHYGLFAPSGATWSGKGTATLTSGLAGQGYLTVALLPDASGSTLDLFEQYAYNFVRDTTVDWNYAQTDGSGNPVSEVRTTYQFTTENKAESSAGANETLACLFPHQWKHTNAALTGLTYFSPRGTLKVHEGSSFTTTLPYRGVLPFMPDEGGYDASTLAGYVDDLEAAPFWQNGTGSDTDTYFSGKDLNRTKQGIPIAQQVGDTGARDSFLGALETRLQSWFSVNDSFGSTAEEEELFYYHDDVGSLIGYPDGFGSATILNDHHFHYGYMINAAAEIARMDDQWVDEYGDMVELVIREYANWERPSGTAPSGSLPVDSPSDAFPFLRNFDPYSGHSWAGGNGAAADCNNQESSSEAVNAYAGMIKWGELTGNTALRDAAIYMYTHEVHAVWDYWFDPNHDSFPDTWGDNVNDSSIGGPDFNYASMVWGTGYDHHVFWNTSDQIEVFGINWLPINAHSLYLGWDEGYANKNWGDLVRTRGSDTDFLGGWKTAAWGYRAFSDSADAVSLMEAELPLDDTSSSGSSSAFTYHFVHNVDALGSVDTSIVADVPMHAVFDNGGSKTYVAYNPTSSTKTVTFSDGYQMDVPANAQKTSNGSVTEGLATGAGGSDGGGGSGGDQSPYNGPHSLPGTVQAEDFDTGGSGVAYSDADSANNGGAYRDTAVDLEGSTEGGYNVGWTEAGEWLEYTVQVDADGTYDLNARVASSGGGGAFHVEVDGTDVTGSVSVGGTGGWQSWTTVTVSGIDLTAGEHVLRVAVESAGFNLNWLEFVQASSGGASYSGTAGDGWSATVTEVGTDQYEWAFEPNNAAGWADVQFDDGGGWVGYRMDDSDGDNVHLHTRDTSGDGSSIDFRFVYDDGTGGQYMTDRYTHTF